MTHKRSSSRRSRSRRSRVKKGSNVLVFKLIDPICQSLLFILFIYCFDTDTDIPYLPILELIIGWQIVSCLFNFFLKPTELLKKERVAYLVIITLYLVVAWLIEKYVTEKVVVVKLADHIHVPLHESILEGVGMIISFWYYVICFREIRAMLTARTNESL